MLGIDWRGARSEAGIRVELVGERNDPGSNSSLAQAACGENGVKCLDSGYIDTPCFIVLCYLVLLR